jgi:putative hemolysin
MDPAGSMQIVALIVLVLLSAFFSGTETAFTSFNKTRMKTLAQDGNKKAKSVMWVEDNYEKFLSTILVGNNIVNITASTISTLLFTSFIKGNASLAATVSTAVMTVIILMFGEISPKFLGKDFADSYTLKVVDIVRFMMIVFTPLTAFFSLWKKFISKLFKRKDDSESVIEDEIITMVEEAQNEGDMDEHEGNLIKNAIEFTDLEVSSVLTPRIDIIAVSDDMPISEISELFRTSGFSRLPVYSETIDNIIGVIHEKDFYRLISDGERDFKPVINKVMFITESMKISKLLRKFQEEKSHMAIVVDEYGGTAGIVTMEDVLEGLVGEIWDEHDEIIENIKAVSDDTYLVNGSAPMNDLSDIHDFSDEVLEENATVNGWVLDNLGKIPEVGDKFDYENLSVEILETDGKRASEIKIKVNPLPDEDDDDDKNQKDRRDDDDDDREDGDKSAKGKTRG